MTDKPYTDADVKLVAATFITEAKKNPIAPSTPPWFGAQTRMLLGPTEHDIARAVLDALAANGRLAPVAPYRHVIAFADDGTWSLDHPPTCPEFTCQTRLLAEQQMAGAVMLLAGARFECSINGLCDRFLLGDRIEG